MKSIKQKLIIYFSIILIIISSVFGFLSIRTTQNELSAEVENTLALLAQERANLFESRLREQKAILETIASQRDITSMDWETQQELLITEYERLNFLGLGIVSPDGTARYQDGNTAQLGDRDYVQRAFEGESNVSDVIISRVTNAPVIMYAVPVEVQGEVVSVLIARADGESLSNTIDDMGYGEEGYAYIMNSEGNTMAHPNRQFVLDQFNPIVAAQSDESLATLGDAFARVIELGQGIDIYEFDGETIYSGFAPIEGTEWFLAVRIGAEEIMAFESEVRQQMILITIIILLISLIPVYFLGKSLSKPITVLTEFAEKIAKLDVRDNVPETLKGNKDETGRLARAFQTLSDNIREFIQDMTDTSQQVAASSEELTATSQQSAMAAEEVAKTIEEIAEGATDQAKDTETGVTKTIELNGIIEEDLKDMARIEAATAHLSELRDDGVENIRLLTSKTKETNDAIQTIYKTTLNTNESAEKISEASQLIENIATQTNLLALNAAIEAARAGEAGKGFSVVAEEIRTLAEQSTQSVKDIDSMLKVLQDNSHSAVDTMKSVLTIIEEQMSSVETTESKFDGISEQIENVKDIVTKSVASVETMDKVKSELSDIMQNLAAVAEENAAGTEEASASVEEQTASMGEIANASEGLAKLAEEMQEKIQRFKA
ncbi:methyl-accepting chemotaxis protein [Serpentinicella sp. ANB-PHB4]|uniref:methyl-accepting chemotaxis protein n=1 Tax=Serpentinicella sp. ANB-PHB4 TaxID=3074076 RepID=UPI00285A0430|nr:methyl-accepting chemotaxis protein [Serpentinicella sp. ANB-PHB4]MDR5659693.1 methyl-accepting chemotaxis protein [Serpentinicella sp. ANB-PHB4]